jgi:hypothetical protein
MASKAYKTETRRGFADHRNQFCRLGKAGDQGDASPCRDSFAQERYRRPAQITHNHAQKISLVPTGRLKNSPVWSWLIERYQKNTDHFSFETSDDDDYLLPGRKNNFKGDT